VTKSNVTSFTATMELSADPDLVTEAVANLEEITVDMLLPGALLNASVTKVTGTACRLILVLLLNSCLCFFKHV
jgi:hypothetical protein